MKITPGEMNFYKKVITSMDKRAKIYKIVYVISLGLNCLGFLLAVVFKTMDSSLSSIFASSGFFCGIIAIVCASYSCGVADAELKESAKKMTNFLEDYND